jgi:hypothetical protein
LCATVMRDEDSEEDALAAAALGEGEASEAELLERLRDPEPEVWQGAEVALRERWREEEGPFAAGELEAAMDHLRGITSREQVRHGAQAPPPAPLPPARLRSMLCVSMVLR